MSGISVQTKWNECRILGWKVIQRRRRNNHHTGNLKAIVKFVTHRHHHHHHHHHHLCVLPFVSLLYLPYKPNLISHLLCLPSYTSPPFLSLPPLPPFPSPQPLHFPYLKLISLPLTTLQPCTCFTLNLPKPSSSYQPLPHPALPVLFPLLPLLLPSLLLPAILQNFISTFRRAAIL